MAAGEVRQIAAGPVTEYHLDHIVVRFDGSVVEVLGMGDASRYHLDFLGTARVEDRPDRKGRYGLEIALRSGGAVRTTVDESCRLAAGRLVEDLRRAGVPMGG